MHRLGPHPNTAWRVDATRADLTRTPAPPRPMTVASSTKTLTIDRARTAMIVVDMQNDFCHPDGWLASIGVDVSGLSALFAPLQRLLPKLRADGVPVIWVNWGNRPDRLNLSPGLLHVYNPTGAGTGLGDPLKNGARVLEAGSWAAAVVDALTPLPDDIRVDKMRMSGFWDTPLDAILRQLGITTLLFGGVNSDQCVLATLMDANFLGYDTILVDDCAGTTSPSYCAEATRYNVATCFGFVVQSQDLVEALP